MLGKGGQSSRLGLFRVKKYQVQRGSGRRRKKDECRMVDTLESIFSVLLRQCPDIFYRAFHPGADREGASKSSTPISTGVFVQKNGGRTEESRGYC